MNKWEILRELRTARQALGVSDRQLTVLQALLSFHPDNDLDPSQELIVFPSNAKICERLNGMPCSTMRRHVAGLVKAGLLIRRDSPNGKRFVGRGGDAYGFDLGPLPRRYAEFADLAAKARDEAIALETLRRRVSLLRRDLAGLIAYGTELTPLPLWNQIAEFLTGLGQNLRRNLSFDVLRNMEDQLRSALSSVKAAISRHHTNECTEAETDTLSTNASQIEQHQHRSNKYLNDSERVDQSHTSTLPPLSMVVSTCSMLKTYGANQELRNWDELKFAAESVYPMMGISRTLWEHAIDTIGSQKASIIVAIMLENYKNLRSPNGYLRTLTRKAEAGTLSLVAMVRAENNRAISRVHSCEQGL